MTGAIHEHVSRYIAMNQRLGYTFATNQKTLLSFARFAADRNETFIRSGTAIEWASASKAASQPHRARKFSVVHAFACWLHVEDARHEVPPRDALGRLSRRRPQPHLLSVDDIQKLLTEALAMEPADTIVPLTWHHLFGLIAVTGLRISEAIALTLEDVTPDGLIIRDTKFRKSRMVALQSTTWEALNRYLAERCKQRTPDRCLFALEDGRYPSCQLARAVFRRLAERVGIRKPGAARGPTPHSLRHSFAIRSLESLGTGADPSRHMLALATYLGHAKVSDTYWYLDSTPALLRGIAEAAEHTHSTQCGGSHD